jgi:hypothetical protein
MRIAFWLLRRFETFRLPEQQNTELRAEVKKQENAIVNLRGIVRRNADDLLNAALSCEAQRVKIADLMKRLPRPAVVPQKRRTA